MTTPDPAECPNGGAPAIRFAPPLLFLGLLLLGPLVDRLLHLAPLRAFWPLGMVAALVGAAFLVAANLRFRKVGENPVPWTGSNTIVDSGVYRFSRNPMYLAMALMQAGLALVIGSISALVLVVPAIWIVQTQVIAREEAFLRERFGANYVAYCRRVRRWI
ncbi:MAG: isoprenylcysteine carboxylmethyltransferase family protein [Sphingomonas sp.]|jgi:protein-S-isoprenylcysteine O-methyltransferase Ste14